MKKIFAFIRLIRLYNVAIAAASVGVGVLFVAGASLSLPVVLALAAGGFVCGGANILNDYYDVSIDRINRPEKPLPAGEIKPQAAFAGGIILSCAGVVISVFINKICLGIAAVTVVVLLLYNVYVKRIPPLGNIFVSVVTGFAFLFGSGAAGKLTAGLIPAGFSFLFHFGREIIKDAEDIKGDAQLGAATLPLRIGIKPSLYCAAGIFLLLIIFTFYPYILLGYSRTYMIIAGFGVDLVLLFLIIMFLQDSSPVRLRLVSRILKSDMIVGLAALLLR